MLAALALAACAAEPSSGGWTAPGQGTHADGGTQPGPDSEAPSDSPDAANWHDGALLDTPTAAADAADWYDGALLDTPEVDTFLTAQMQAAHVPGMAVAIVKGPHIGWAKGYGLADISENRSVTPDTLFILQSVSKTVTATALMHLIEDPSRGLSLDDDVGAKVPFNVRNPNHPGTPISYRMLLTHTSSLVDGAILDDPASVGDGTTTLHDWLVDALSRDDAWSSSAPGTSFSYSNTAVSLAGYLVEQISGQSLQDYCRSVVFMPLGMTESSFSLSGLDPSHIAMPYEYSGGHFQSQGQYGFPDYPDGRLRTSANQLARFLAMFMQKGLFGGARVLQEATVDEMRRIQFPSVAPDQGLIWFFWFDQSTRILGHNGAYLGASTDMWFDPATNAGYIILTNGGVYFDHFADTTESPDVAAMDAINFKLMDLAHALP